MRKLKIGIRTQLTLLVCVVALFSLVILAITCGVYFSINLGNLRAERLEVISQLKAAQLSQSFAYLFYQVYYLSTRDVLTSTLSSYKAGNTSTNIFSSPRTVIQQYLDSSDIFVSARMYDLQLNTLTSNSASYISGNLTTDVLDYLYPLSANTTIPKNFVSQGGYVTGPVVNASAYFMCISIPIYGNDSVLVSTPDLSGFLSVIMNVESLRSVTNDSTAVEKGQIVMVKGLTNVPLSINQTAEYPQYEYVFPPQNVPTVPWNQAFQTDSYVAASAVLNSNSSGSFQSVKTPFEESVAVGYSRGTLNGLTFWGILVEQQRGTFLTPVNKLKNIIIGVVVGLAVLLCIITFPMAFWFVRPIRKLKTATEVVTRDRRTDEDSLSEKNINMLNNNSNSDGGFTSQSNRHSINSGSMRSPGHMESFRIPQKISLPKRYFKDELTELTEAFNIMTDELEKQYTHLEDRVRSRTRELEASKIQAEAANEAKTVFIANISHELRTPLNGILGMTAIAMADKDTDKVQESLKLIYRSGELLLHILTELLTFSKNTLKRSKLEQSDFEVVDVAYQIKSIFGKIAVDQRVNLNISVKPLALRKMIMFGDSNRIIQVVMNLVSNSLKFTPVDGSVTVKVRLLGEYDATRSRNANYREVYVLTRSHGESGTTVMNSDITEETDEEGTNDTDSTHVIKEIDNLDLGDLKYGDDTAVDNSDTRSLKTITTVEYNDAIFNAQFEKPLPVLPSSASATSKNSTKLARLKSSSSMPEDELEIEKNNFTYATRKLLQSKRWVLEFEVEDTGPGIEPALQEKVFEPFVQGDQTLSRSYGGTGLGLSICRQLAEMMLGTLTLKSTLGVGSKFTFRIPLAQTREVVIDDKESEENLYDDEFNPENKKIKKVTINEIAESSSFEEVQDSMSMVNEEAHGEDGEVNEPVVKRDLVSKEKILSNKRKLKINLDKAKTSYFDNPGLATNSSTGTANSEKLLDSHLLAHNYASLRILIAEDNLVNQEVIKRMLKLEGFTNITLACDGSEAIDLVKDSMSKNENYDIIFMDVQMPKVDGLLATKTIRNVLHYERPIVALTAFADESNVKECLQMGMSGFLPKPIRRTQLRKIITEFCPIILGEMVPTPNTEDKVAAVM